MALYELPAEMELMGVWSSSPPPGPNMEEEPLASSSKAKDTSTDPKEEVEGEPSCSCGGEDIWPEVRAEVFKRQEEYEKKVDFFTKSLDLKDPKNPINATLLYHRANEFIKLGCYNNALADIEAVFVIEPFSVRAICSGVRAHWGLGQYDMANNLLKEKLKKCPALHHVEEILELKRKSKEVLKQRKGEFDMIAVLCNDNARFLDVAEYTGPVEIAEIEGKGCGLRATKTIEPGQLVLVSKALALALGLDTDFPLMDIWAQVLAKLGFEPELGQKIYKLFAGPDLDYLGPEAIKELGLDVDRLREIVCHNFLKSGSIISTHEGDVLGFAYGLYELPSYINHSCSEANASKQFYGDVLMIRACRQILPGEEVLISYADLNKDYAHRAAACRGFECTCPRCLLEKAESPEIPERRLELLHCLYENQDRWDSYTHLAQLDYELEVLRELEALQKDHPRFNLLLANKAVFELADTVYRLGDPHGAGKIYEKAHCAVKHTAMAKEALVISITILGYYGRMGEGRTVQALITKWINNVKHDLVIAHGTMETMNVVGRPIFEILKSAGRQFGSLKTKNQEGRRDR